MDETTRRRATGRREAGPILPAHGGHEFGWPPEGWPTDAWPPPEEACGEGWLPEEHYNAALWESS